jgi:dihydroxy-acid dehydratase
MKTSVISEEFRDRYLSNPDDPDAFEGRRRRVRRAGGLPRPIDDPASAIDETRSSSCAARGRSAIRAGRKW